MRFRLPSCPLERCADSLPPLRRSLPAADAARDFVQACLRREETARPTAEQLLEHPWLQEELAVSDAPFSDTIVQRLQRFGLYGRWAGLTAWEGGAQFSMHARHACHAIALPILLCSHNPASSHTHTRPPIHPPTHGFCLQVPPGGPQGAGAQQHRSGGGPRQRAVPGHAPGLPAAGCRLGWAGHLFRGGWGAVGWGGVG
jgi:serine/threonine protein kinase